MVLGSLQSIGVGVQSPTEKLEEPHFGVGSSGVGSSGGAQSSVEDADAPIHCGGGP